LHPEHVTLATGREILQAFKVVRLVLDVNGALSREGEKDQGVVKVSNGTQTSVVAIPCQ
jgi:hypothetical protein